MDGKNDSRKKKPEMRRTVIKGIRMTEAEAEIIHNEVGTLRGRIPDQRRLQRRRQYPEESIS